MTSTSRNLAMTRAPRVAVIGAGLAGLMTARELSARGCVVTVFDKSRAPGGRAATRRHGELQFDHGAQYFTHRDPRLAPWIDAWAHAGLIAPWDARIVAVTDGIAASVSTSITRWVAVPGMRALGEQLAHGLNVTYATTVRAVDREGAGWRVTGEGDIRLGTFDHVLVTAPAAQAHALLAPHAPEFTASLAAVRMHPCLALMAVLAARPSVAWDAAFVNGHPVLSWVARNASKPGRMAHECWVIHASASWSAAHLEHEAASLVPTLVEAFADVLGVPIEVRHATAHRWRYAIPDAGSPIGEPEAWYDDALGLGVAGDWCAGGRVEGALTSGLVLADLVRAPAPPD
jgi:predicted NAD/FAD-dependent oxidoreductase